MNKILLMMMVLVPMVISSCATTPPPSEPIPKEAEPQAITAETAGKYAIYAMMASNAYHQAKRIHFPVEKSGWIQVDEQGKPTTKPTKEHPFTGLAYDIYEKQGTDEVVFAIRGTDSKWDYIVASLAIISPQYKQANKEFGEYLASHPDKKVKVTGHSLGGGVALSISVHHGVDAIVFDSSPRVFDGLGDKNKPANRVEIHEDGEVLEKLRKHWAKFQEVVAKENVYQCNFDFKGESKHRGDYLARGLLELGVKANPELAPILEALQKK